jgi:hypothetical protein
MAGRGSYWPHAGTWSTHTHENEDTRKIDIVTRNCWQYGSRCYENNVCNGTYHTRDKEWAGRDQRMVLRR